jgi:hypothetical protein
MENISFVIWMIGWPAACSITSAYAKKCGVEQASDEVRGFSALIELVLWVVVGIMLWNR